MKKNLRKLRPSEELKRKREYNRAYAARRAANGGKPLSETGKAYTGWKPHDDASRLGPRDRAKAREGGISMAVMILAKKLQKEATARIAYETRVGEMELTALLLTRELLRG